MGGSAVLRFYAQSGEHDVDSICVRRHIPPTSWPVRFSPEFDAEFMVLSSEVQIEVLAGGDKAGVGEARFYRSLISVADRRFDDHLSRLTRGTNGTHTR